MLKINQNIKKMIKIFFNFLEIKLTLFTGSNFKFIFPISESCYECPLNYSYENLIRFFHL